MKQFTQVVLFLLLTSGLFAQQRAIQAPLSQKFIDYQENKDKVVNKTAKGHYLGERPAPIEVGFSNAKIFKAPKTIPSSYDLRTENEGSWISPVRDQGQEGACWAFATYGAVESYILKQGSGQSDFSEQNLATCHNFDWTPSDGGNYYLSAAYLSRHSGPISESDDPYTLPSNPNCVSDFTPAAFVQQVRFLPGIGKATYSADLIKQTIIDNGAVYVNIRQEGDYINNTDYTYYYNGTDNTNHAVLLVGWDDNKVVTGGSLATPTSNGAWIIRNSWGSTWGDDGFYYVSYEDTKALSSIAIFPSDIAYDNNEVVYNYDDLGQVSAIGYSDPTAYGLIKYTAEEAIELTKLGLYIPSADANVDFTVYSTFDGSTLSGKLGDLSGQTCDYPGFHTFDLSSVIAVSSGSDFYLQAKVTTPGYNYPLAMETVVDGYSSNVVVESNKCWDSGDGSTWWLVGATTDYKYDLCIKAYANKTTLAADFKSDITSGNGPLAVQFTDMSTGNINTWSWDFDNDGTVESTEQNPSYTYTENGAYTVSLIVSDGTLAKTEVKTAYINVNSDFVMQTGTITTDEGVFYDAGGSVGDYNINTKDTLVFYPATSGSYLKFDFTSFETESGYDSLCIFNGSSITAPQLLKQHGSLDPFMVYATNEEGALTFVFYSDGSTVKTGWKADISILSSIPSIYTMKPGSYTVSEGLFYDGGGKSEDYAINIDDTLTFYPSETGKALSFKFNSFKTESCCDNLKIFDGASAEATLIGTYAGTTLPDDVTASNADGALTFVFHSDYGANYEGWEAEISMGGAANSITADFTSDKTSGDTPLTIQFTDASTGNPTTWAWDFNNDGTTDATTQSPSYTYTTAGIYTVKLTVGDGTTTDDEIKTDFITVTDPVIVMVAAFSSDVTSGTTPLAVAFTDASTGSPTTWAWDFNNDGTTDATTQNPSYTYTTAGNYTVKLTVSDGTTTDDEIKTDLISVTDPVVALVAGFTTNAASGEAPLAVQFTDASTGNPTTWAWDFDNDGTADATTQNPSYTYTEEGIYSVKLTVGDGTNTVEEVKVDFITVTAPPEGLVSNFTADLTNAVSSLTANFTNLSSSDATTYSWDFNNDGTVDATTKDASYTYNALGEYSVKLTVSDGTESKDTVFSDYIHVMEIADSFKTEWTWQNPKPQGNRINNSIKVSNNLLYAACDGGIVMKSTDGGTTWQNKYIGKNLWLYSVFFLNDTIGYVPSEDGTLFKTYNGAETWVEIENNISDDISDVWFFDENDGIAICTGKIYTTTNGGFNWTLVDQSGSTAYKNDIHFIDRNVGFVVGGNYDAADLLKTVDGGKTWMQKNTSTELDRMTEVCFTSATTGYAVGDYTAIIKTTDAGESWTPFVFEESIYVDFGGISFIDESTGYVAGNYKVYKTIDAGATWTESYNVYGEYYHTIIAASSSNIYAMGDAGIINKTTDSGASWEIQNGLLFENVKGIGFGDANTGFAVSYAGPIIKTSNGGETWTASTTVDYYLSALDVMSTTQAIAVGNYGKILMTNDGGTTWESKTNPDNGGLKTVQAVTSTTFYAAGTETLVKSTDSGETWSSLTSPYTYIHDLLFTDAENGFLVGGESGVSKMYKTADGGSSWTEIVLEGIEEQLYSITLASTDTLFVSGSEGTILRSTDNGVNWTDHTITPPSGVYYYGLLDIAFSDGKNGIAAGEQALVYTTNNAGVTWNLDTTTISSAFYNSIAYVGNKIYFAASNGNILMRELPSNASDLIADFTSDVTSGNNPLTVQFTNESIGEITSWSWNFGDGTNSSDQSPSHTYTVAGSYSVSLEIDDGVNTATATKTDYIEVIDFISADFSVDETYGEAPLTVGFTDLSDGNVSSWSWDFNNDGVEDSDEQNPSYTYTVAGVYSVELIISNSSMSDTVDKLELINVVAAGCNDLAEDYIMNFEDEDDVSGWKIIDDNDDNSTWGVFSEVGIDGTQCAAYQYNAANAANDWLISGCFDLVEGVEYEVSFYYATRDEDYSEKLKVFYGTNQDETMENLIVDLDDIDNVDFIKSSNIISISSSDVYYFGWQCYSDADQYALLLDSVVVKKANPQENVVALFTMDVTEGPAPLTVNFTDISTGNPTAWSWDFDNDGVEDSDKQNPSYVYTEVGDYSVALTVSNTTSSDKLLLPEIIKVTTVGIDETMTAVNCYPNPVNSNLHVTCEQGLIFVKIFNTQGQLVYSDESLIESKEIIIDVSNFQSGIYYLNTGKGQIVKIIKE